QPGGSARRRTRHWLGLGAGAAQREVRRGETAAHPAQYKATRAPVRATGVGARVSSPHAGAPSIAGDGCNASEAAASTAVASRTRQPQADYFFLPLPPSGSSSKPFRKSLSRPALSPPLAAGA